MDEPFNSLLALGMLCTTWVWFYWATSSGAVMGKVEMMPEQSDCLVFCGIALLFGFVIGAIFGHINGRPD